MQGVHDDVQIVLKSVDAGSKQQPVDPVSKKLQMDSSVTEFEGIPCYSQDIECQTQAQMHTSVTKIVHKEFEGIPSYSQDTECHSEVVDNHISSDDQTSL